MRAQLAEAVVAYEEKPREQWLFDYPAQVLPPLLTSTQLPWERQLWASPPLLTLPSFSDGLLLWMGMVLASAVPSRREEG